MSVRESYEREREILQIVKDIPLDRLQAICEAEKLIGKTVYEIKCDKIHKRFVHSVLITQKVYLNFNVSESQDILEFGKTVFLTEVEAIAKLEADNG